MRWIARILERQLLDLGEDGRLETDRRLKQVAKLDFSDSVGKPTAAVYSFRAFCLKKLVNEYRSNQQVYFVNSNTYSAV